MTIDQLLEILFPPGTQKQLTLEQSNILRHASGPAWVLAGPGSGKTEVLAAFVMRLLFVSGDPSQANRVLPESIFVTTFTEKAAKNLEDRIGRYREKVVEAVPLLASVDVSKLRIGTLHGLCNDILQEFRAPNYQNVRLMDEFEQAMFVYEQMSIIKSPDIDRDKPFWAAFPYLFTPQEWKPSYSYLPNKWVQVSKLVMLFNRLAEDRVDTKAMRTAGTQWARLADIYDEYAALLRVQHRTDFANLQVRFLEFLPTAVGQSFTSGDGHARPPLAWVLIDEYQDTNLIQETIYLTLANHGSNNIVVVGDDDQALYRFRGGSVECMVTFDQACKIAFGDGAATVQTYRLVGNFRSHPSIVSFCNTYITAFPSMNAVGSRAPGKLEMESRSSIAGPYPAVGTVEGKKLEDVALAFAATVADLIANKVVQDPSQCCLLLTSTKETPLNAQKYVDALNRQGLKPYNPRNKAFLEQEEVAALLGTISSILDPDGAHIPLKPDELNKFITNCRDSFLTISASHAELADYVARSVTKISNHPGEYLSANLQEIIYYILSQQPFCDWHQDPVRRLRLARLTALFESFSSMPVPNFPNVQRGRMKVENASPHVVASPWTKSFYFLFFGYLSRAGLDEVSDDEVICPPGFVPIMTIHQAKGLEFPFVFVGHMSKKAEPSAIHELETALSAFPVNPARVFVRPSAAIRAELDLIRQFYVAYSRAEWALILMGTTAQLNGDGIPSGPTKSWLRNHAKPL